MSNIFSPMDGGVEEPQNRHAEAAAPPTEAKAGPASSLPSVPFSLTIWPPSQRTRDAVAQRLVETLSSPSVLSKRYGVVSPDEAAVSAARIEAEAFSAASSAAVPADATEGSIDEGIETLQIYSKEISRRMLEFVKARASTAPASGADITAVEMTSSPDPPSAPAAAVGEGVSSLESETPAA